MEALVLDIRATTHGCLGFDVQIVHQGLRGSIANYTTSKGFSFLSRALPALSHRGHAGINPLGNSVICDTLYLRGSADDKDDRILHTKSVRYITRLQEAVIEYNKSKCVVD